MTDNFEECISADRQAAMVDDIRKGVADGMSEMMVGEEFTVGILSRVRAMQDALKAPPKVDPVHQKILNDWSHKNDGTPETHEKASKTRQGNIASLFENGHIGKEELAAAEAIYAAWEIIARDVSIRGVSYSPRIDNQSSARDVLVEGIRRIRMEVAYSFWRKNIPQPQAMILDMLTGDRISYSTAAKRYGMHKRKTLPLLLSSISLWMEAEERARKSVDEADVAAAHAGLV